MATRKISYLAHRRDARAMSIQSEAKAVKGKDKLFEKDKGLNLV